MADTQPGALPDSHAASDSALHGRGALEDREAGAADKDVEDEDEDEDEGEGEDQDEEESDNDFGEDFDDFEEGGGEEDFGDFDDGFQQAESSQPQDLAVLPQQALLPFVGFFQFP